MSVSRSSWYYKPQEISKEDLLLMRAIDEQYLKTPFYRRRRMAFEMRKQDFFVGEKKARISMRMMGLGAIYPKPKLSKANKKHKNFLT